MLKWNFDAQIEFDFEIKVKVYIRSGIAIGIG